MSENEEKNPWIVQGKKTSKPQNTLPFSVLKKTHKKHKSITIAAIW